MTVFDLQRMESDEIAHVFVKSSLVGGLRGCTADLFWPWGSISSLARELSFSLCQTKLSKCGIVVDIHDHFAAYFKARVFLQPFVPLSHTKRGGSFSSCVQRWPATEQFLLTETATLFIENKCWHLEAATAAPAAAAAVSEKKSRGGCGVGWGRLYAVESASGAIWQQSRVPGGAHLRIKHAFQ